MTSLFPVLHFFTFFALFSEITLLRSMSRFLLAILRARLFYSFFSMRALFSALLRAATSCFRTFKKRSSSTFLFCLSNTSPIVRHSAGAQHYKITRLWRCTFWCLETDREVPEKHIKVSLTVSAFRRIMLRFCKAFEGFLYHCHYKTLLRSPLTLLGHFYVSAQIQDAMRYWQI